MLEIRHGRHLYLFFLTIDQKQWENQISNRNLGLLDQISN